MGFEELPLALFGAALALGAALAGIGFALRARRARRLRPEPLPEPPRAAPTPELEVAAALAPEVAGAPQVAGAPEREEPEREVAAAPAPALDLRAGLRRTRESWLGRLETLLRGRAALEPALLEELESLLYGADVGARTAQDLLAAARAAQRPEDVRTALEARALEILLARPPSPVPQPAPGTPRVVLVVGVNGSGKTTTIGKLAARHARAGQRVLVAAADTFRAAAIEQLSIWADRAGVAIVKSAPGGDPAAVAFDAVKSALAQGVDVVLIDTAGRLQSHAGLMDELAKIARTVKKQIPDAPHEVLLVLDANTGQNGLRQAQEFLRTAGVTGIALAKLDGTAKGGVVLGIAQESGLPVRYVGVGERLEDLVDFDPRAFVSALFAPVEGAPAEGEVDPARGGRP